MQHNRDRKVFFRRQDDTPQPEGLAVAPREGESADSLIRRFKRIVDNSGVLREYRERQSYEAPSEAARTKRRKAAKRRAKASGRD